MQEERRGRREKELKARAMDSNLNAMVSNYQSKSKYDYQNREQ
jgi:hypothetical protein